MTTITASAPRPLDASTDRRLAEYAQLQGLQGITARRLPPRTRNHSRSHRSIR